MCFYRPWFIQSFTQKSNFKFCTENALLGYVQAELWKTIALFEISSLEFTKMQNFVQNKKNFKYGTKNVLFGSLGRNLKKLLPYLKSAPSK